MAIKAMDWSYIGQKARVYRNLNNGRISVQVTVGKTWRVIGHVLDIVLQDVIFHVSEAGRQRVIREQCKNVHAWAEGTLMAEFNSEVNAPINLAYNPYQNISFIERGTNHPINRCKYLVVCENQVFVTLDAVNHAGDEPTLVATMPQQLVLIHSASLTVDLQFAA